MFLELTKINLLSEIYDDKELIREIIDDYNRTKDMYLKNLLQNKTLSLENPLKLSVEGYYGSFEEYLIAIYELKNVNSSNLAEYMGKSSADVVSQNFRRFENIFSGYVNIDRTKQTFSYSLSIKGIEAVEIMNYFKTHFENKKNYS